MTLQKNTANNHAPAILTDASTANPRRLLATQLPTHERMVAPGQERAWPEFPAGGCDPDFAGGDRLRRPSRLQGVVNGVLRFVRG